MVFNYLSAMLFSKLQRVGFYKGAHTDALFFVGDGDGRKWLDVGCGCGLVAVEAAKKGFTVLGVDKNRCSIEAARKYAEDEGVHAYFSCDEIGGNYANADVVSAASLLAVMPDRVAGLQMLYNAVKKGGHLVIIEPTEKMNIKNARQYAKANKLKQRHWLCIWAFARQKNIVDPSIYETLNAEKIDFHSVLGGMLGVWIIKKSSS